MRLYLVILASLKLFGGVLIPLLLFSTLEAELGKREDRLWCRDPGFGSGKRNMYLNNERESLRLGGNKAALDGKVVVLLSF